MVLTKNDKLNFTSNNRAILRLLSKMGNIRSANDSFNDYFGGDESLLEDIQDYPLKVDDKFTLVKSRDVKELNDRIKANQSFIKDLQKVLNIRKEIAKLLTRNRNILQNKL